MAKIYLDELVSAMNYNTFDTLASDSIDASNVSESISNFIQSEGKLQGKEWDVVRNGFTKYCDLFSERIKVANNLSMAIKESLTLLINYIEDYEMLDDSKVDEIRNTLNNCNNDIINLKNMRDTVNNGEYVYDVDKRNWFSNQISILENSILELQKLLDKLEGLNGIYSRAENILNGAYMDVCKFSSKVLAIQPSKSVEYISTN